MSPASVRPTSAQLTHLLQRSSSSSTPKHSLSLFFFLRSFFLFSDSFYLLAFSRSFSFPGKVSFKVLMSEKGQPLPKFGEWDVNDPASAEGFTVIFNKARDEKKTGGNPESPAKAAADPHTKPALDPGKAQSKKWFCCILNPPAES